MNEHALERAFVDARGRILWPWRLVAFCFFMMVALALAITAVYPLGRGVAELAGVRWIAYPWLTVLALVTGHALTLRFVDPGTTWTVLGLAAPALRPPVLLGGLVLGALAILVPSALLLQVGWLRVLESDAGGWMGAAVGVSTFLALSALSEELLVRGYALTVLRERFGWQMAVAATSVLFALMHLRNPGVSALSITVVALAGVFLGGVRVVTGSVYAAWLAHFAWNWVMAVGLHTQVSGFPSSSPGYRVVSSGPSWATGGVWGPEGGVFAAAGLCIAIAVLFARPSGRALLAQPIGRAETAG